MSNLSKAVKAVFVVGSFLAAGATLAGDVSSDRLQVSPPDRAGVRSATVVPAAGDAGPGSAHPCACRSASPVGHHGDATAQP